MKHKYLSLFALPLAIALLLGGGAVFAAEILPGGILGATKEGVRAKMGEPSHYYIEEHHARRHWLFPVEDIDTIRPMLWARPDIPIDDVFPVEKDGKNFLYRAHYERDKRQESQPVQRAVKCWALFKGESVTLADLPHLVPEFEIATKPGVLVYQQKSPAGGDEIVVTFLVPESSDLARAVSSYFKPPVDDYEWSPSFEVVLRKGESENITLDSKVHELVITVGSQTRINKLARVFNIKDIANPFPS
ncbi:MAG: hypothetical protein V3V45_03320 [Candidatus Brocadiales bacterium]